MLVITKVLRLKRRYVPRTKTDMWCVRDTDSKKVVHGPTQHSSCLHFIKQRTK